MSLIDLFRKKRLPDVETPLTEPDMQSADEETDDQTENSEDSPSPDIPENVFIEYEKQPKPKSMDSEALPQEVNDLQALYRFLEQNLEKRGYEDALTNPDTSYMDENIKYIQCDLDLTISKVKTYYSGHVRIINFHIETRKRNGMIETVEELISHRDNVEEEIKVVSSIESDSKAGIGIGQNLILSYKKGFRNGFAAITYNTILSKQSR